MIALVGDTHLPRGARRLPEACGEILRTVDLIVHTGDFTALSVLEQLRMLGRIEAVHGNMDEVALRELLPERLVVEHDGLRIGVVHSGGPRAGREVRLRAWFPECDLVAYGHSHQPEIVRYDECWIVNPGSPTERRRAPAHTIAVVENGRPRLVEV